MRQPYQGAGQAGRVTSRKLVSQTPASSVIGGRPHLGLSWEASPTGFILRQIVVKG
jgi:hypothetical protein